MDFQAFLDYLMGKIQGYPQAAQDMNQPLTFDAPTGAGAAASKISTGIGNSLAASRAIPVGPGGRPVIQGAPMQTDSRAMDAGAHEGGRPISASNLQGAPVINPNQGTIPGNGGTGAAQVAANNAAAAAGANAGNAAAGAPPNAAAGGFSPRPGANNLPPNWRQNKLFPYEDPAFAMQSALIAQGINPYRANPFIKDYMDSAQGMALAHLIQNRGANTDDVEARGGPGQLFGDFLKGQIGSGSMLSTMQNARGQIGGGAGQGLLGELSAYADSVLQGGKANPFMELLYQQAGTPSGLAGMLSSLTAPALGGKLGDAYERGTNRSMAGSARRYIESGDPALDWWQFVTR